MANRIRYGIIGCGSMGREHIENILALGHSTVTALADPHALSRELALGLLEGAATAPAVFERYQDLLEANVCDAVVIATPNFTHAEVMRHALPTDAHLLIEKPLCTTLSDCADLVQRAKGRASIVWVAQEYRYMPPVAEMIRLAHAGEIGTLHQVAIREHREPFYPKVGDWNRFNVNTGGTLVEKCCHYFNLMELILQEQAVRVFATGGIGGVHQGAPFDVSADLQQLARSPVVVVCAGAKAILDLPATLEVLETMGVPVVGYQTDEFPAFYSRSSGLPVSVRADTPGQVAAIARAHWGLGMRSAVLLTVPPPEDAALPADAVQGAIQQALTEAAAQGIHGQKVTPFMLGRVSELTHGDSLKANLALLLNNGRLAAAVARELAG